MPLLFERHNNAINTHSRERPHPRVVILKTSDKPVRRRQGCLKDLNLRQTSTSNELSVLKTLSIPLSSISETNPVPPNC